MNPITTIIQKRTIDTQKLKRKGHKGTTKENNQTTKKQSKRRNEQTRTTKTVRKKVLKWQQVHIYQ